MLYYKITQAEFATKMKEIIAMKNPELRIVVTKITDTINEYYSLIRSVFNDIYLSEWYHSFYNSSNPTDCKNRGCRTWYFTRYIGIKYDGIDLSKQYYYNPSEPFVFGLYFEFQITIPDFTGSNLDVSNNNKINYAYSSSWSVLLRYPIVHDRFNYCERLNFSCSLQPNAEYFHVMPNQKAYILLKFDEFTRFYRYLCDVQEFEKKGK